MYNNETLETLTVTAVRHTRVENSSTTATSWLKIEVNIQHLNKVKGRERVGRKLSFLSATCDGHLRPSCVLVRDLMS